MRNQDKRLQELIAEQAAEWYVAHRDGALDETQTRQFMNWLRASPAHVAEYLGIAGLAHDLSGAAQQAAEPLAELLKTAAAGSAVVSLDVPHVAAHAQGDARPRRTHRVRARHMALAATIFLVLATGLLWRWSAAGAQAFATRHGEQRTLQLPDNTVVRLNSDSAITVRFDKRHRDVEVRRGQAYFEVAKDAARPFSVRAGEYRIEDVGTTFDVYLQNAATTITVVEGSVRIWDQATPVPEMPVKTGAARTPSTARPLAELPAGMQVSIASSGRVATRPVVDVRRATAWVEEKIVFDSESIGTVAAQFNRYNHQQIVIDDEHVGRIPISGVFRSYDVPSFVQFLNGLPGVRAEVVGDRIVVASASPR